MTDRWQLLFRLFSIQFEDRKPEWWRDSRNFDAVLSALATAGLWKEFESYGIQGDPGSLKKIASRPDLVAKSAKWGAKPYVLQKGDDLYLAFNFRPDELTLAMRVGLSSFGRSKDGVLEQFITFAGAVHGSLAGKAPMGPDFEISLSLDYPRPRPPHFAAYGAPGAIVNFYSKAFLDRDESDRGNWNILANHPLPAGASREISGDLLTIRWIETLQNEELLRRQRSTAEVWQNENLHTPVDTDFNDLGDGRVIFFGLRPHPPLTMYDSVSKIGYKAIVRNPDGSFERDVLDDAYSWLKQKAVPDGTPVEGIRFILPNRDSAIQLHGEASSRGVEAVLYTDNQKGLWNPFPPGMWIEP